MCRRSARRIGAGYVGATAEVAGQGVWPKRRSSACKLDKAKDEILVLIPLQMEGRNVREIGVAEVFEKAGFKVTRLDDTSAHGDAAKTQPMVTAAMLKNKNIKLVAYSITVIGQHELFMKAVGEKAGRSSSPLASTSPRTS